MKSEDVTRLKQLRDDLLKKQSLGAFDKSDIDRLYKHTNLGNGSPDNALMLELRCLAASAFDHLGQYDQARAVVESWASTIQFELDKFLSRGETSFIGFPAHAPEKACFLLQAGVAEYRYSNFGSARAYLETALKLYELLNKQAVGQADGKLNITTLLSTCHYWLGCIETYASNFLTAEEHYTEGLKLEADASLLVQEPLQHKDKKVSSEQATRPPTGRTYTTGRLLMGLGLLQYHMGSLSSARSNLLAAKVLLQRDSQDLARRLRVEMLLLTVQRTDFAGAKNKEAKFIEIIEHLKEIAEQLKGVHERYYWRAMCTMSRVQVDLADSFRAASEKPRSADIESKRTSALKAALAIVEEQRSQAHTSVNDKLQLDVVKIRVLRRLCRLDEAIFWGEKVTQLSETRNHLLLYTEILFALGHAYYDRWKRDHRQDDLEHSKRLIDEARGLGIKNPRAQAVACLHLARIAQREGHYTEAQKEWREWKRLSEVVKLAWIDRLADKVETEMNSSDTLIFSLSQIPTSDIYPEWDRRLKHFLLTRVISNEIPVDEAAMRLGISKQTYYNWKELDLNTSEGPKSRKPRATRSATGTKEEIKNTNKKA